MDFKNIAKLQIHLMKDLKKTNLTPSEKIKYGKTLVASYKKAKHIIKSKVQVEGDWEEVLRVAKFGLENLVGGIEADVYHTDEITAGFIIGYVDLLTQIQFLNYEEETQYKFVDESIESEIDMSFYEDLKV